MVVRSVVISLEAQYAKLVAANRVEALDTDSTDAESQSKHSTSHQTKLDQVSYQFQALFTLVGLVFGTRKIADVPLQEIIVAKSSFALFTLFYVAPGILVILIVVFASAPILYCSAHCNEMFLDMQLGIIAC
ncbi:hypothetical protein BASA82_000598 [Batrachochytrium salamandrivorans]|nr:hypothetical protein BASA82_000598 [Batrachochytrium salamandrivorans]